MIGLSSTVIKLDIDIPQELRDIAENGTKKANMALNYTIKDLYRRAPGVVSSEAIKVYNVKKAMVKPGRKSSTGNYLELTYKGKHLQPTADTFHLTPTARPGPSPYTLRMTVKKGRREVIGRYRKERTGAYKSKTGALLINGAEQRLAPGHRGRVGLFTTVSMPQMVSNTIDGVKPEIEEKLGELTQKRLEHNLERVGL